MGTQRVAPLPTGRSSLPGLYVHVPFCARACPYCDFDFEVGRRPGLDTRIDAYLDGISRELELRDISGSVRTLYLGGGTPSALGPDGLVELFDRLGARVDWSAAEEVCVELNPEHVDASMIEALASAGVGRVSLGVQSLSDAGLVELGRAHRRERAMSAMAQCVGRFDVSADLIVGRPGERVEELDAAVDALDRLGIEHVSIYALTIEADTPWVQLVRRKQRDMPDEERQGEALEVVESALLRRGFEHYEIASYAKPGRRARHNQAYWRGRDYWGVGPSAHSATHVPDGVRRRGNARGLDAWRSSLAEGAGEEQLTGEAAAGEALWLALRLLDGVRTEDFLARFPSLPTGWMEARTRAQRERGNLEWATDPDGGTRIRVAPGRWLWHDAIAVDLVGDDG